MSRGTSSRAVPRRTDKSSLVDYAAREGSHLARATGIKLFRGMKAGGTLESADAGKPAGEDVQAEAEAPPSIPAGEPGLEAGEKIGEYAVVRVIGTGGFGTVYEGEQPLIGKRVAIKVLSRRYSGDPEAVSRFVGEARVANQIGHRNIVGTFSFGKLPDGRRYHVMDLVKGETLDAMIRRRGALPVDEAIQILRGVASALDAAHKKGVVHRDLKPANVLVSDEEGVLVPKVIDFGIAKLLSDDERAHKTQSGAIMGTPLYMAPEQCRGKAVDHLTDVYAFGVLAYEMLTGAPPFDGDDSLDLLMKHTSVRPEAPSKRRAELAPEVDKVVLALLAKDPAQRPSPLGGVVSALSRAAGAKEPSLPASDPVELPPSMAFKDTLPAAARRTQGNADEPPRRSLWPWLAAAGAAGLVIFVVARGAHDGAQQVRAETPAAPPPPPPASAPADTPSSAPAPEPVPVPPAQEVKLVVNGAPPGTEVVGPDGGVLGTAPGALQVPEGDAPIEVELRKSGFLPETRTVTPDRDRVLEVRLRKAPRRTKAATHKPGLDDFEDPFK